MADTAPESRLPAYLVAFRTPVWDAAVARMAARTEAYAKNGRFVILADDDDAVPVEAFPKVAQARGGEHALSVLLTFVPAHDYYVACAHAVQVNANLDGVVAEIAARELDLVAPELRRVDQGSPWHSAITRQFPDPWTMLPAVTIMSRRALELVCADWRARDAQLRAEGGLAWTGHDGFVPSAVASGAGMRMADLAEFVRLPRFSADATLLAGEPGLDEAGTIAYPVLGPDQFIIHCFRHHPPADFMNPESSLRRLMAGFSLEDVAPHLRRSLEREDNRAGIARLQALQRGETWVDEAEARRAETDIARGKPCTQSSRDPNWSARATVEADAGQVVSGELAPDCAHHTGYEADPWWQVDLGQAHALREVEILNRTQPDAQERLNAYLLLGSVDGASWSVLYFRPYGRRVSGNAERPERTELAGRPVARFVRLQVAGYSYLHMRRVRIWGDPLPG